MPRAIGSEHRQNATRSQRSCQIPSATRDQVAVAMELGRNNRCFGTGPPRQAGKRLEYSPLSAPPMAAAFDGAVGGHAKQPRVGAALAIVGLPYGERRLACGRPFRMDTVDNAITKPARRMGVFSGAGRWRTWSDEDKARVVAENREQRRPPGSLVPLQLPLVPFRCGLRRPGQLCGALAWRL
jgi:hypothetical protein